MIRREARWMVALGLVGAAACDANPTTDPATNLGQPRTASAAAGTDLAPAPPSRGRVMGGQNVQRIVDWPDAAARHAPAYQALSEAAQRKVDEAPVPVLLPGDPALQASAVVTTGAHWAAVSTHASGLFVSLHISGQAKVYEHIKPVRGTDKVRGYDGFVTHNEGVWVATWIEHGVAYDLELECASLKADACQDPAALMDLAEGLVFVGGRGETHP